MNLDTRFLKDKDSVKKLNKFAIRYILMGLLIPNIYIFTFFLAFYLKGIRKHYFFFKRRRAAFHCIGEKEVPIHLPSLIRGPDMRVEFRQNKSLPFRRKHTQRPVA